MWSTDDTNELTMQAVTLTKQEYPTTTYSRHASSCTIHSPLFIYYKTKTN